MKAKPGKDPPKLPREVEEVRTAMAAHSGDELQGIGQMLITSNPDICRMWRSLEKHSVGDDNLWVWAFLRSAHQASNLANFQHMPAHEREALLTAIKRLSVRLAEAIDGAGLNFHLVYSARINFNGFRVYEDFSETNRARIDDEGQKMLSISALLRRIPHQCRQQVTEQLVPGNTGAASAQVRFCRILTSRNELLYETPLNSVVATAANALYGSNYGPSDIRKLKSR